MFCSKCGAQATASAKFCQSCGKPLTAGSPNQPPPMPGPRVDSGTMRGMGKSQVAALARSLVRKVRDAVGH